MKRIKMTIAHIRVSSDKQDTETQTIEIIKYTKNEKIIIDDYLELSVDSKKTQKERKIETLRKDLKANDCLIVTELSRLVRNMLEVMKLLIELIENNVKILFVKHPELNNLMTPIKNSFSLFTLI